MIISNNEYIQSDTSPSGNLVGGQPSSYFSNSSMI